MDKAGHPLLVARDTRVVAVSQQIESMASLIGDDRAVDASSVHTLESQVPAASIDRA